MARKNKNKNKNSQAIVPARSGKKQQRSQAIMPVRRNVSSFVPFVSAFVSQPGHKVPDGTACRTTTFRSRGFGTITPNLGSGTDQMAFIIIPSLANSYWLSPTFTGTSVSAWGTGGSAPAYSLSTLARYRIVAWGFRLTLTSSPNSSGGRLDVFTNQAVATHSGSTFTLNAAQVSPSSSALAHHVYAIQPGFQVEWRSQRLDNHANEFVAAGEDNNSWTWPCVHISGASSGTKLLLEIRYDLEYITEIDASAVTATPAAPSDRGFMQKMLEYTSTLSPDTVTTAATVASRAYSAARYIRSAMNDDYGGFQYGNPYRIEFPSN
jgi:hypothetical protein